MKKLAKKSTKQKIKKVAEKLLNIFLGKPQMHERFQKLKMENYVLYVNNIEFPCFIVCREFRIFRTALKYLGFTKSYINIEFIFDNNKILNLTGSNNFPKSISVTLKTKTYPLDIGEIRLAIKKAADKVALKIIAQLI